MSSTFTENTGIELIADGEQTGAWGQRTNDNFDIVDRALNGSVNISLSGTTGTVTTGQGSTTGPETFGQFAVLVFTGSPSGTNTVTVAPNTAQKTYVVRNTTNQSVVLTQGSGGNVTVPAGRSAVVSSNGGGASAAVVDLSAGLVPVLANAGVTATTAELNILDGVTATTAELNILDGVTATTAELNILDGVTATTAELNILDGVTATTAELNILDGVTATTAELNILDGVTATTAELNVLDGIAGIASQAEAEAGTNNTTLMTPLRSQQQRFANGPLAGFRNAIINGNFDHWQRGVSVSAFAYGADRWVNNRNGTAATQSQQEFALGQTDVPNEPEYFVRTVVSSVAGAGNFSALQQLVEGVRTFAGQTVTLSFFAKADAAKNIAVEFVQHFGGGGSPSAPVTGIGVTTFNLTTTFQKFTVTFAIPSLAGKTLGTGGGDRLQVTFFFDAGSNFNARTNNLGHQSGTFDIAQVQLEAGSVATPFERRPVGTELALCQRYFEAGGGHSVSYASSGAALQRGQVYYKVSKRASATHGLTKTGGAATSPTASTVFPSLDGFVFAYGSTDASQEIVITYTADAEL